MTELSNYSEKFNIWVARKLPESKEVAFTVTDDEDFKRVEWAVVIELEVLEGGWEGIENEKSIDNRGEIQKELSMM